MAFTCIHCRSEIDPKYKACPYCGEPISDFLRRYSDSPIDGKYQILARLGVGGMGEVYKVLHVHLNAIRVIKLMRPAIAGDKTSHERFLREARLATKISHPNVAALYDFSTLEDGSWYMVWEYIEGTNLHELIEEDGPLSPRYAAKLSIQALRGLNAIHQAGIVHRDISPENLMITRANGEERVKIIDLGIAKQWNEATEGQTKTGMFVGKWKYCSPEHLGILPEGQRIDGRADIYSFGIVLYEMLTGVTPFQADTPHGFLVLHASEQPRPLREVNPGVTASPDLEALILRAMEKSRDARFSTARDFADALESLMPSLSEQPGAPPPLPLSAEETVEPTKVIARANADLKTVATGSPAQTTMPELLETVPATAAVPVPEIVEAAPPKRRAGLAAVAIGLVAVVGGSIALWNRKPAVTAAVPAPAPARASVVVSTPGRIAINAFPWASVTNVRNVTTGAAVPIGAVVTPAAVEVPPGRYELTLSNPAFKLPETRTVDVTSGADVALNVQFVDAAGAPLPPFLGGSR